MRIVECDQGDATWLQARTGRVTASEVGDAISMLKRKGKDGREAGDSSAVRDSYKAALVAEILTGRATEHFVSKWMEHGTALEASARAAYEDRNGVMVQQVGLILHPTIERASASPDGLIVGETGGLEIKVPKIETHMKYIFAGILPKEYEPQVMFNLACSEYDFWDFLSYCPELPERHQQFKVRVYRDDQRIDEINAGVLQVLSEVDEMIAELDRINPPLEAKEEPMLDDTYLTDEDLDSFFGKE